MSQARPTPSVLLFSVLLQFSLAVPAIAQPAEYTKTHFLSGCVAYREKFVHSIVHAVADYNKLMDAYKPEMTDRRLINRYKDIVNTQFSSLGVPSSHATQFADPLPDIVFDNELISLYTEWHMANAPLKWEFRVMVDNGLVKGDYPYQLLHASELWEEMQFYGFRAHDRIADIGAGNGFLPFLLRYGEFPISIWMTEIEPSLCEWMREKILAFDSSSLGHTIHIVEASEKAIGIPYGSIDKMIMRLTFHHLSNPAEIMEDVHRVLAPDGVLFITEEPKKGIGSADQCQKLMSRAKLEKWIIKSGFEIIASRHEEDIIQYKCRSVR